MISWKPKPPKNLKGSEQDIENAANKRWGLMAIVVLAWLVASFLVQNTEFFPPVFMIGISVVIVLWLLFRNFFNSYLYRFRKQLITHPHGYQDYSWKDSLVMGAILIIGLIVIFAVLNFFFRR